MTMSSQEYREYLREVSGHETLIFLTEPHFDAAVIGVTLEGRVVYDEEVVRLQLMNVDGMDQEGATEYFDFNIAGAYVEGGPIFMSVSGCNPQ